MEWSDSEVVESSSDEWRLCLDNFFTRAFFFFLGLSDEYFFFFLQNQQSGKSTQSVQSGKSTQSCNMHKTLTLTRGVGLLHQLFLLFLLLLFFFDDGVQLLQPGLLRSFPALHLQLLGRLRGPRKVSGGHGIAHRTKEEPRNAYCARQSIHMLGCCDIQYVTCVRDRKRRQASQKRTAENQQNTTAFYLLLTFLLRIFFQ